jgi:hypothetical protein
LIFLLDMFNIGFDIFSPSNHLSKAIVSMGNKASKTRRVQKLILWTI